MQRVNGLEKHDQVLHMSSSRKRILHRPSLALRVLIMLEVFDWPRVRRGVNLPQIRVQLMSKIFYRETMKASKYIAACSMY